MNRYKTQPLLYVAIIFLLMAQYVVNDRPWDRICRWMALLTLVGVIILEARRRFSRR